MIARGIKIGSSGLAPKYRLGGKSLRRSSEEHLLTSALSTTRVENSILGQMKYSQRIASPLPDAQTILQFEVGGAARHVVIRMLLDRWRFLYVLPLAL